MLFLIFLGVFSQRSCHVKSILSQLVQLDTSSPDFSKEDDFEVKIADLGNACWVVSYSLILNMV